MKNLNSKIIEAVKKRPILYVSEHPESKCMARKINAWREIQNELDEDYPIASLRRKWTNMKDTYRKCKMTRLGISKSKVGNWPWAKQMSFLDSEMFKKNEAKDTLIEEENLDKRDTHDELDSVQNDDVTIEFLDEDFSGDSDTFITHTEIVRKRGINTDTDQSSKKSRRNVSRVEMECDGVDLLFLGYADSYKKLSKSRQSAVKFGIAKLLLKAELDDLKCKESTSSENYDLYHDKD